MRQILTMEFLHPREMGLERPAEALGQDGDSLAHSLAFPDGDLPISEIHVFDPQAQAF